MIKRFIPTPLVCGLIIGVVVGHGCAKKQIEIVEIPENRTIVFCTAETESANGKLFNKRIVVPKLTEGEIWVTGKLIFNDLSGWYMKKPVPSVSKVVGAQSTQDVYDPQPSTYIAYWTGADGLPCVIRTRIVLANTQGVAVDVEQLSLEYRSLKLSDHMLLGPNNAENRTYFTLQYGQTQLEISGFKVIRLEGDDIQHGIEIEAGFPDVPDSSSNN